MSQCLDGSNEKEKENSVRRANIKNKMRNAQCGLIERAREEATRGSRRKVFAFFDTQTARPLSVGVGST